MSMPHLNLFLFTFLLLPNLVCFHALFSPKTEWKGKLFLYPRIGSFHSPMGAKDTAWHVTASRLSHHHPSITIYRVPKTLLAPSVIINNNKNNIKERKEISKAMQWKDDMFFLSFPWLSPLRSSMFFYILLIFIPQFS